MLKLPWFKFFAGDWLKDPALTLCTPATRGVWIDLLCAMHELDRSGELCGTADQLARAARCSTVEFVQAVTDLQTTGAADVTERNGTYQIRNRRMRAENDKRKSAAERQQRHRDQSRSGPVTRPSPTEIRSQKSEPPPPAPASKNDSAPDPIALPPDWLEVVEVCFSEGMGTPVPACEAARNRGCLASEAMREVRHWQQFKPAWGIGLLYRVMENLRPEQRACWPEPGQEFAKAQSRADLDRSQQKTANGRKAAEAERQKNQQEREARERDYGAALDAMKKPKLREFVAANCNGLEGLLPERGKVPAGMVRDQILLAMSTPESNQ